MTWKPLREYENFDNFYHRIREVKIKYNSRDV